MLDRLPARSQEKPLLGEESLELYARGLAIAGVVGCPLAPAVTGAGVELSTECVCVACICCWERALALYRPASYRGCPRR